MDGPIRRRLIEFFGIDAIKAHVKAEQNGDDTNDSVYISLDQWDVLSGYASGRSLHMSAPPSTISLLEKAGESITGATMVCIYKNAARQVASETQPALQ